MDIQQFVKDQETLHQLGLKPRREKNRTTTLVNLSLLVCFCIGAYFIISLTPSAVQKIVHNKVLKKDVIAINSALEAEFKDIKLNTGGISRSKFIQTLVLPLENKKQFKAIKVKKNHSNYERLVEFIHKEIVSKSNYKIHRPMQLAKKIVEYSLKEKEDPFFITALIFAESSFRANAVSSVGAKGLMQIMPATGKYIAKKINYKYKGTKALFEPETNLKLGIAYIKYLKKLFNNNTHQVLLAYNWGPTNVRKGKSPPKISLNYSNKIHKLSNNWKKSFAQA